MTRRSKINSCTDDPRNALHWSNDFTAKERETSFTFSEVIVDPLPVEKAAKDC